jgi:plastocyanin
MRMLTFIPVLILAAVLGMLSAAAALVSDQIVHQRGRMFSIESASIKKGAALTFLNDDNIPHNIASISKGNQFNLGSQAPGTSTEVTFTTAGEVDVICAIHPRMKMTVTITN